MRRDGCSTESAPSSAGSIENNDPTPENGSVIVQTDQVSDTNHYNSTIKKAHIKLTLGLLEKLNMLIFVVFICYVLWSIPANYGLFTSEENNSTVSEKLQHNDSKPKDNDAAKQQILTSNYTLFGNISLSKITHSIHSKQQSSHNQSEEKINMHNSTNLPTIMYDSENKHTSRPKDGNTRKIKNRTWNGKRTRTGSKCKECDKNRNGRKRNKMHKGKKPSRLERDQIRKIMEKVAEEILAGNTHSTDNFHSDKSSVISLSYNNEKDNRSQGEKNNRKDSIKKTSTNPNTDDWFVDEDFSGYEDETWTWSPWGECTVTCGVGQQERRRRCGAACREMESMVCVMPTCPGEPETSFPTEFYFWEGEDFVPKVPAEEDYIDPEVDTCGIWITCNGESSMEYIEKSELPSCPCFYPMHLDTSDELWDRHRRKFFPWMDASSADESVNVFKPGAWKCIRSKLIPGITTMAAQHCCYDKHMHLITRGKGAGTPNLVSPQISTELHRKIDIRPWIICKGDWTRYNQVLQPNNMMQCKENPDEKEILRQIKEVKNY